MHLWKTPERTKSTASGETLADLIPFDRAEG
jgi:hypothetical protein